MAEPNLLILCEGPTDKSFINALMTARNVGPYRVQDTTTKSNRAGGNTQFGRKLRAIKTERWFGSIRSIAILTDSDDDHVASRNNIIDQVNGLNDPSYGTFAVDGGATNGAIPVHIRLIPSNDSEGNLETLCLPSAKSLYQHTVTQHVEAFCAQVGTHDWQRENSRSKHKLRILTSTNNESDPAISLRKVFSDAPNLIPLDHGCFDELVDFIISCQPD